MPDTALPAADPGTRTHADVVRDLTSRWPEHRVAPSLGRIAALTEASSATRSGRTR